MTPFEERWQRFLARVPEARRRYPDFDALIGVSAKTPIPNAATEWFVDSPVGHDIAYLLAQRPRDAEWWTEIRNTVDAHRAFVIFEHEVVAMLENWCEPGYPPLSEETQAWLERMGMRPD